MFKCPTDNAPPSRLLPQTLLSAHYFRFADKESGLWRGPALWSHWHRVKVRFKVKGVEMPSSLSFHSAGLTAGPKGQMQRLLFLWVGDPHPCLSPHSTLPLLPLTKVLSAPWGGCTRALEIESNMNRAPGELGSSPSPMASCVHPHLPGCATRPRVGE